MRAVSESSQLVQEAIEEDHELEYHHLENEDVSVDSTQLILGFPAHTGNGTIYARCFHHEYESVRCTRQLSRNRGG